MSEKQLHTNPFRYLEANALSHPNELAFVTPTVAMTWIELKQITEKIAAKLRFSGVRPGHRVMLAMNKTNSWLLQLALFHEGAISVSANPKVLSSLKLEWLITDKAGSGFPIDRTFLIDAEWLDDAGSRFKAQEVIDYQPSDVIRISFTSGTTGVPKAIPITAALLQARYDQDEAFWKYPKPFLSLFGFDSAIGFQTPVRALVGALPYFALSAKDHEKWQFISQHKIKTLAASPLQMSELMYLLEEGREIPDLELVTTSGSAIAQGLVKRLVSRLRVQIQNSYGSTEAGGATSNLVTEDTPPGFAGLVIKKAKVAILDESFNELPPGSIGRVAVKNPVMVHEYLDNPAATGEFFVNGWFLPGDLGRLDDEGMLWLEGRSSEVINSGGKKINPDVVDEYLKSQTGVVDAATFGFQDRDGLTWSVAAVVGNAALSMKELSGKMRRELSKSGAKILIPTKVIPRNENGKVLRSKLAEDNRAILQKLLDNR
jgi:acyl-coenzyme A synthetase/AMP-(fatty) acid ligase